MGTGTWVEFDGPHALTDRKTAMWFVKGKGAGAPLLGRIAWYSRWRQYTFFPADGTVYNDGCLRDIAQKCREETENRRMAGEMVAAIEHADQHRTGEA